MKTRKDLGSGTGIFFLIVAIILWLVVFGILGRSVSDLVVMSAWAPFVSLIGAIIGSTLCTHKWEWDKFAAGMSIGMIFTGLMLLINFNDPEIINNHQILVLSDTLVVGYLAVALYKHGYITLFLFVLLAPLVALGVLKAPMWILVINLVLSCCIAMVIVYIMYDHDTFHKLCELTFPVAVKFALVGGAVGTVLMAIFGIFLPLGAEWYTIIFFILSIVASCWAAAHSYREYSRKQKELQV